jgi:hypothetical protein
MNTDENSCILPYGVNQMGQSIVFAGVSNTECIEVDDHKLFPYLVVSKLCTDFERNLFLIK